MAPMNEVQAAGARGGRTYDLSYLEAGPIPVPQRGGAAAEVYNAVHKASQRGDVAKLQKLVNTGASVNEATSGVRTTAAHFACTGGHTGVLRLLSKLGADLSARRADGSV